MHFLPDYYSLKRYSSQGKLPANIPTPSLTITPAGPTIRSATAVWRRILGCCLTAGCGVPGGELVDDLRIEGEQEENDEVVEEDERGQQVIIESHLSEPSPVYGLGMIHDELNEGLGISRGSSGNCGCSRSLPTAQWY